MYEDDKKRGEWKISVVELLVIGTDGIVKGATVRVITNRIFGAENCSTFVKKWSGHWDVFFVQFHFVT